MRGERTDSNGLGDQASFLKETQIYFIIIIDSIVREVSQNPITILISLIFSGNRVSLNIGQSSKFVSGRDILSSSSRSLLPRTLILHSFAARQRCLNARSGLTRILNVTSAGVRFRVTTHDCIMLNAEKCHVSRHCDVPRYFDPIIVVGSLVSQTYRNFILNNKLQI